MCGTTDYRKDEHIIFFLQMRWSIENRLGFKEVWDLEIEEGKAAQSGFKIVGMYKVAGQRRVIAIVDIRSADDLDRTIMGTFLCGNTWNLKPSGR